MDKPLITYRDFEDHLPQTLPPIPVGRVLTSEERERLIERHAALSRLLTIYRPDTDPDLWTCATYSELIAFVIEALQNERARMQSL